MFSSCVTSALQPSSPWGRSGLRFLDIIAGSRIEDLCGRLLALCGQGPLAPTAPLEGSVPSDPCATGAGVAEALKLLAQHIDDEEYDLFPHVFNALDPEQWDEIELAHTAVEAAFASRV